MLSFESKELVTTCHLNNSFIHTRIHFNNDLFYPFATLLFSIICITINKFE